MGTIRTRKRADGTVAFNAQIIKKSGGRLIARKAATFATLKAAELWVKKTERLLEEPQTFLQQKLDRATVGDAINSYVSLKKRPLGKTQNQIKNSILDMQIASRPTTLLDSVDLVNLARELGKNRAPSTVSSYVSFITETLRTAKGLGYLVDVKEIEAARHAMNKLGLIGSSNQRNRRPTLDELDLIMTHFFAQSASYQDSIPMERLVAFALFSSRRQSEITELKWVDLDEGSEDRPARWTVFEMKDPKKKLTNHVRVVVPPRAIKIAKAMPASRAGPFAFNPDTISARFTRACQLLGIEDLTFHDLRHEAVSHLFELGQSIPEVALVSGHKSWQTLQRYTHINHFHDKYADWKWFEYVNQPLNGQSSLT